MKAPMYIEQGQYKDKILNCNRSRHLQTLKDIQQSKSRIDCWTTEAIRLKKNKNYFELYKADEVYRENQNLLGRLLSITKKPKNLISESNHVSLSVPRSMNCYIRKNIQSKIQSENKEIANRISSISPSVKGKALKKDFDNHLKLLANVSKFEVPCAAKKRPVENLSPLIKKEVSKSPSFIMKNPYFSDGTVKKEWKIAELSKSPDSHYIMAIPIALSPQV